MQPLNKKKKLEEIRIELTNLKKRLDDVESILTSQEELLDLLSENTKYLLTDALGTKSFSEEDVMKMAFTSGKLPRLLKK